MSLVIYLIKSITERPWECINPCMQVLQRCQNAAALHVGDATCASFTFEECALSCSDGCQTGCEVGRRERQCQGLRLGGP